jgi:hypothetical protein
MEKAMSSKQKELPLETKRKLVAFGQTASQEERSFMQAMADRQREPNGNESEIESFPKRSNASEFAWKKESLDFFRKLESFGCGKLIMGRRKQKTRLQWGACGAIAVAKAFLSEDIGVGTSGQSVSQLGDSDSHPQSETPFGFHRHKFLLRKDMNVHFTLPLDLSKEEANRLAEFIRSLPFQ